jgi:hypothetical protein
MALAKIFRTTAEEVANDFDALLYGLMLDAERNARNNPSDKEAWRLVCQELRRVRPRVRKMMHASDLEGTE